METTILTFSSLFPFPDAPAFGFSFLRVITTVNVLLGTFQTAIQILTKCLFNCLKILAGKRAHSFFFTSQLKTRSLFFITCGTKVTQHKICRRIFYTTTAAWYDAALKSWLSISLLFINYISCKPSMFQRVSSIPFHSSGISLFSGKT